jgi:hypothetical protein
MPDRVTGNEQATSAFDALPPCACYKSDLRDALDPKLPFRRHRPNGSEGRVEPHPAPLLVG